MTAVAEIFVESSSGPSGNGYNQPASRSAILLDGAQYLNRIVNMLQDLGADRVGCPGGQRWCRRFIHRKVTLVQQRRRQPTPGLLDGVGTEINASQKCTREPR